MNNPNDDLLRHAHRTIGDSFAKLTPKQAEDLAAQYQEDVMKHLFGFLTATSKTPTTSAPFPTNEKENPDSLN